MSGHSKWSTIKRKKGANDAARGKIFTKHAREIPDCCGIWRRSGDQLHAAPGHRSRTCREHAQGQYRPGHPARRGLDKDAAEIEEITYEGYGPHGVAIIVECLTDNRNRTIADVRRCFTRGNGSLGEPNSVAWQFTETGYMLFNLFDDDGEPRDLDPDDIFMAALDAGAPMSLPATMLWKSIRNAPTWPRSSRRWTMPASSANESSLIMKPNTTLALDADEATSVLNLIEALEELDDASNVYHNLELTDELVAQFA